jgi:peptidyl-prolyl cis-trans isomerase SurA
MTTDLSLRLALLFVLMTPCTTVSAAAQRPAGVPAQRAETASQPAGPAAASPGERIVAVVNGDVVSQADVDARARLFALSSGLPPNPDVLVRLRPQIAKQLVDERLRLQEIQKRKIAVSDKDISNSVNSIEQRNGMPAGGLRTQLGAQGVALRTLYDQVRVQIGWTRVLREELGSKADISDADIDEQIALQKAQTGQPEYRLSEIFIPVDDPSKSAEVQRFADTVIQQLHAGAPFSVVAAQFSQSQTALQGGDLGWVRANQVDPEIASIITQMPEGAVSNPIRVAGGFSIVSMHGKREIGRDLATMLTVRQAFLPFSAPLDPNAPTDQQKKQLGEAQALSKNARSCDAVEAANKAAGDVRPTNPGEVRLEGVSPALRGVLTGLQISVASKPLISNDGIAIIMICTREQKNLGIETKEQVSNRLIGDRVELTSRQLLRDVRRRAVIDMRS